jgi:hypothetical protein
MKNITLKNRRELIQERRIILELKNELVPQLKQILTFATKIQDAVGDGITSKKLEKLKKDAKDYVMNDSFKDKVVSWAKENPKTASLGLGAAAIATGGVGLLGALGVGGAAAASLKFAKDPLTKLISFTNKIAIAYKNIIQFVFTTIDDNVLKNLNGNESLSDIFRSIEENEPGFEKKIKKSFIKSLKEFLFFSKIDPETAYVEFVNIPLEKLKNISSTVNNHQALVKKIALNAKPAAKAEKEAEKEEKSSSEPGEKVSEKSGGGKIRGPRDIYSRILSSEGSGEKFESNEAKIKFVESYLSDQYGFSDFEKFKEMLMILAEKGHLE